MNRIFPLTLLLTIAYFAFLSAANAAPMYSFTSAPIQFDEANVTVGFKFTANQNLAINALGFYDYDQDGLSTSHAVGLYDSDGNLLTSTTVQSGINAALDGNFRYSGISLFKLSAGQSYILAGLAAGEDGYTYGNIGATIEGISVNPAITINPLASVFLYSPHLSFPTQLGSYDLYPMVNLKFEQPSPVPLPAAFSLFGIGLAGIRALKLRYPGIRKAA